MPLLAPTQRVRSNDFGSIKAFPVEEAKGARFVRRRDIFGFARFFRVHA